MRRRLRSRSLVLVLLSTLSVMTALAVDGALAGIIQTFYPYRPNGAHARRDIEFHWSDTYRIERGDQPGIPPEIAKTLDQLALRMAEDYSNPMNAQMSDIELAFNYLFPFGDTYDRDSLAAAGIRIPTTYLPWVLPLNPRAADTTHLDVYIYRGGEQGYSGGQWPSQFVSIHEDTSTGRAAQVDSVYWPNSVMFSGPASAYAVDTLGTGWTRGDRGANAGILHEFAHAFNVNGGPGMNELMSSAVEQLIGQNDAPGFYEVPYTWPLLSLYRGPRAGCADPQSVRQVGTNYQNWRSFAAYSIYNFRGTDTAPTRDGFRDDLFYKWAHATPSKYYSIQSHLDEGPDTLLFYNRSLRYLGRILNDDSCSTCATKSYFRVGSQPRPQDERLALLLHNWRVASYVNQPALAEGQYGFAPQSGFSPASNLNAWHSSDGCEQDNSISVPPEVTLSRTGPNRQRIFSKERLLALGGGGTYPHPMRVSHTGAEYWIVRSDASLASGGPYTLQVRIQPDSLVRSKVVRLLPTGDSLVSDNEVKLVASVIGYTTAAPTDSLWSHPEWATLAVEPLMVDVDSLEKPLMLSVPNFGTTYKAALVVITASTGRHLEPYTDFTTTGDNDTWYEFGGHLDGAFPFIQYRAAFAIKNGAGLPGEPTVLSGEPVVVESAPTWNPNNSELAYIRTASSGLPQLYRRSIGGAATLVLAAADELADPDWSPRGDLIAIARGNITGGLGWSEIWSVTPNGSAQQLTSNGGLKRWPAYSPNGRTLAFASRRTYAMPQGGQEDRWSIETCDAAGGTVNIVVQGAFHGAITSVRWAPDAASIWFKTADSLFVVNLASGQVVNRTTVLPGSIPSFDLHRSTGRVAVEQARSLRWKYRTDGFPLRYLYEDIRRAALYDTTRQDADAPVHARGTYFQAPRWSPDGTKLAYAYGTPSGDLDIGLVTANTDHAPVFTSASVLDVDVATCQQFQRTLSATDADGETVTYQALFLPPGATLAGNILRWRPAEGLVGDWYVTLRALDGTGGLDQRVMRMSSYDAPEVCECPHYPYCAPASLQPDPPQAAPTVFALAQNRPNPARGSTSIRFDLPRASHVSIEVFDLLGRRVRRLVDADLPADFHSARWDLRDDAGHPVRPGVYMYRMEAGQFRDRKKMLILAH